MRVILPHIYYIQPSLEKTGIKTSPVRRPLHLLRVGQQPPLTSVAIPQAEKLNALVTSCKEALNSVVELVISD